MPRRTLNGIRRQRFRSASVTTYPALELLMSTLRCVAVAVLFLAVLRSGAGEPSPRRLAVTKHDERTMPVASSSQPAPRLLPEPFLQPVPSAYDFALVSDPNIPHAVLRFPRSMMRAEAPPSRSARNVMAGLALTAVFLGGGGWCVRLRFAHVSRKKMLAAGAMVLLLVGLAMGGLVSANAPNPRFLNPLQPATPDVTVEVVDHDDTFQLFVSPEIANSIHQR
jgi:hypothetical protein